MAVVCDVGGNPRSPAPFPPIIQRRSRPAQRRVVTVAGVDPGVVVVTVENLLDHTPVQGLEIFRRPGATHATRKEAVTGEQMGVSVWIVESKDQRPGGVSDQVDHTQGYIADGDGLFVVQSMSRGNIDSVGVGIVGVGRRMRRAGHVG